MRDPLSWSLPLGRLFGITVRIHLLFPLVAAGLILRMAFQKDAVAGAWIDMTWLMALLFFAVLLHEYGHCFGGRLVDGDAQDILIWPLGGLAYVDVPHTPRAHFIMVACGPLVNVVLCLLCGLVLGLAFGYQPPFDPFTAPFRINHEGAISLAPWGGKAEAVTSMGAVVLARFFWVNWFLFLLNVVLIGFPLDGGRLFQCSLWPFIGYRSATLAAIFAGFVVAIIVAIFAIVVNEVLPLCLAAFIFLTCWQQRIVLETGGEESLFGYDFSQGYTSLERDQPPPSRRKPSWWQRWLQRRAAKKLQREQEQREADERRTDELLDKIQREGKHSLTDEEQRFLKRVSDKYRRNRH